MKRAQHEMHCGLVFDVAMCKHKAPDKQHPESPRRLRAIGDALKRADLFKDFVRVPTRSATDQEILLGHSAFWLKEFGGLSVDDQADLDVLSLFFNEHTASAARIAAGSTIELVLKVVQGQLDRGLAVVRPPGHHAEQHRGMGFCYLNNVGLAAKAALHHGLKRILIVDWDAHFGNGTYSFFKSDPRVLFVSLHRYLQPNGHELFYPGTDEASCRTTGIGDGKGFTVNVAWSRPKAGNTEYAWAFEHLILPIARDFGPELILVSAGFDSARGDPLGGCDLTPCGYERILQSLFQIQSKTVVVLEGGYNLDVIATCSVACATVLLSQDKDDDDSYDDDKKFAVGLGQHRDFWTSQACADDICATIKAHQTYWPCLADEHEVRAMLADELLSRQMAGTSLN